jgi:hypothetical protein
MEHNAENGSDGSTGSLNSQGEYSFLRSWVITIVITVIGLFVGLLTKNFFAGLFAAAAIYWITGSKSMEVAILSSGLFTGALYYGAKSAPVMGILMGIAVAIILYGCSVLMIELGKKGQWFVSLKMNEYKVIQIGEGMLKKYIGFSKRRESPGGMIVASHKASKDSTLENYMPHPVTGRIVHQTQAKHGFEATINRYLTSRVGVMYVGFDKITNVKTFDLDFFVSEHGMSVHKVYNHKDGNAAQTVFDTFTYFFVMRDLETVTPSVIVTFEVQVTLCVTDLQAISYGLLPAGIWIQRAEERIRDISRRHVAKQDYSYLLLEKHAESQDLTTEQITARHNQDKETIYDVLLSEEAVEQLDLACGHKPIDVVIGNIKLQANEKYLQALQAGKIAELQGKAKVIDQEYNTKVAEKAVDEAKFKRQQQFEAKMATIDADRTFAENMQKIAKDSPEVIELLKIKLLSESNIQAIGGSISTLFNNNSKKGGDND